MNTGSIIGWIFLGGGLGSVARYGTSVVTMKIYKTEFPLGTLLANLLACIILGISVYYFKDKLTQHEYLKYFVLIGFCGGFSTFSTFSMETLKLFQDNYLILGSLNILISLSLGIGVLWIISR